MRTVDPTIERSVAMGAIRRRTLRTPAPAVVYRFSGAIAASSFPGIRTGDRFFGRFRLAPPGGQIAGSRAGRRADPDGFVEAVVGALRLRSSGPVEIRTARAPAVLRVALTADRPHPGDALVAVAAALLVSRPPRGKVGRPAIFDAESFLSRIFTLESVGDAGFAEGELDMLYPLEIEAA